MNADVGAQLRSLSIERPEELTFIGGGKRSSYKALCGVLTILLLAGIVGGVYLERDKIGFLVSGEAEKTETGASTPTSSPIRTRPVAPAAPAPVIGSGYVVAERIVTIRPEVGGRVAELPLNAGDRFVAGQRIALLDRRTAEIQLHIARSQAAHALVAARRVEVSLAQARRTENRTKALAQQGVVAESSVDTDGLAVLQLEQDLLAATKAAETASLQVAAQERTLALHEVRAPFDGVLAERLVSVGDTLAPGTDGGGPREGIAVLLDPSSLAIDVDVAQSNAERIASGQSATATLDAFPGTPLKMRVRTILPVASMQKGTVTVRLDFVGSHANVLPNMSAKIAFEPAGQSQEKGERNG